MNNKTAKVIIGQSQSQISDSFRSIFNPVEYQVQVVTRGIEIVDSVKKDIPPDIIVMDHGMRDPDAIQVCRTIKADRDLAMIPILILTEDGHSEDLNLAIEAGADDILVHPVLPNVLNARVRSLLRIKFLTDELDNAERVLYTLARTIEAKDRYTMGHADRVALFAKELGSAMGVNGADLEALRKGGMLHDVGKIAIPDSILTKPGKYTTEEFGVMKQHPVLGCEICEKLRSVRDALPLIRYHHEKLDGSGYPDGLSGDKIPPLVRVVSIVDIYDALRSKRSYKEAFTIDKTFEIMWQEVEKGWWDKNILTVWEKIVRSRNSDPFPL